MNQTGMELQKKIVVALARGIHGPWERIVVNYEMQEEDGGLTEDRRGFSIASDGAGGYRTMVWCAGEAERLRALKTATARCSRIASASRPPTTL